MKVILKKDLNYETQEVYIPKGVIKEFIYDYQDAKGYYKYYYISKKGKKKECKIQWQII